MSNKARSRKRNHFIKVLKLAAKIADLRNKLHKIEEKYYPKLEPGGTVCGKQIRPGERHTLYFDGSKSDPEYINKMAKLFKESEIVILHGGNLIRK